MKANVTMDTPPSMAAATPPAMLLLSTQNGFLAQGEAARIIAPATRLGAAVARHFRAHASDLPLVGALPFDREADATLVQPQRLLDKATTATWLQQAARRVPAPRQWSLKAEPERSDFENAVAEAVRRIRGDNALQKVVLARSLLVRAEGDIDPWWLAQRLGRDASILRYVLPLPIAPGEAPAWLVGASPELLVSRQGRHIVSEPLAGSAPRCSDDAASCARAEALRRSDKAQREHRHVVEAIADQLAPLCRQLSVPTTPDLKTTASMWHLATRIEGELKHPDALEETSAAALAALLHPTPAVCGTPRTLAAQTIAALEPASRGHYAGAFGHSDARGNGAWHLALRCARIQGNEARLYAGAGIVAGSDPAEEAGETLAKCRALLDALGVEDGKPGNRDSRAGMRDP